MSFVVPSLGAPSSYRDKRYPGTLEELEEALAASKTLYVGNLSFYTTEEQIHELFSKVGEIKRIIMGLDRVKKTPCGFCFVEYYSKEDALDCMKFLNGTKLDDRIIRTDIDPGYKPDRQYGRGRSGGQVRDEYRQDYDEGRGGWGKKGQDRREKWSKETYQGYNPVPEGATSSYYSKGGPSYSKKRSYEDDDTNERNPRFRRSVSPE